MLYPLSYGGEVKGAAQIVSLNLILAEPLLSQNLYKGEIKERARCLRFFSIGWHEGRNLPNRGNHMLRFETLQILTLMHP